jgi:hypothetical protein
MNKQIITSFMSTLTATTSLSLFSWSGLMLMDSVLGVSVIITLYTVLASTLLLSVGGWLLIRLFGAKSD